MSDPRGAIEAFIRWVMRDVVFLGTYEATVERQHADGSLDLLPDDARVRGTGTSNVPLRHGLPGVDVRVVVGSRVLLGFVGGDRRRPYAALWAPGSIESISFDGGEASVARAGDSVTVFWPPSCPVVGTIGGLPFTGTMTITSPSVGLIDAGAQRVRA